MSAVSVTPDALGAVLRGYRLPAGGPVVPLNDGDDDHHSDLVVRVAGDVVVRFVADRQWSWYGHQWYTDELLRQQLRFVDHVRTRGVAFPARLRPSDGDWSGGDLMEVRSDGVRYRAVAFAWFPGARAPRRRGRRIAHGAGALLGRLHRAAADFRPGADLGTESLVGWATQVADELADLAEAMPAPLRAPTHGHIAAIGQRVAAVGPLPCVLAGHGDLNLPNVLVRHGRVVGVVDIGRIALVHPLEELANVLRWFSRRDRDGQRVPVPTRAQAVLDGYRLHGPTGTLNRLPELAWLSAATSPHLFFRMRAALVGGEPVDPDRLATALRTRRAEADAVEQLSRRLVG